MKVILLENLKKVGSIGEVIEVKRGFGRNFLIANKKALYASKENIAQVQKIKNDLSKYGLKDSNAKYYIRLFPVKDHVWVTCEVRATRVVLTVGAATTARPEDIINTLRDGWVHIGKRLYLTIFDEGSNYEITQAESKSIAKVISDMRPELESIVNQLIKTIPEEAQSKLDREESSIEA